MGAICATVLLGPALLASSPAHAGEPAHPLRFAEQARDTRLDVALTRARRNDARDRTESGLELALGFGSFPQLQWWRIGGASGMMLRAVDDKTFLVSLPYADLTGGVRASFLEAYAFAGVSWLSLGISHGDFAFGGLAPRVGVGLGAQARSFYVHAFAATEYHPFLVGSSDIRLFSFGLSFALVTRP